jgi:sensor c-di-GMP phosphodiesterase-like protein
VIAEGVETATQLDFLLTRKCDEMQGFFFSPPVPHDAIPALLRHMNLHAELASDQPIGGSARGRRSLSVAT